MIRAPRPAWFDKAKQIAARVPSPVGRPFAAAKKGRVCDLYLYAPIGRDEWYQPDGIAPEDVVLALKEAKGADELAVHVNSPGGFVFDGIAIYNAIRGFEGEKTVYVDGIAASIASVIALAGDRVVTNSGAMWMVHDPAGGLYVIGSADTIEDEARKTVTGLRKCRETILDIYQTNTGRPTSELSALMSAETYLTADEALIHGFTDEVCKPEPMEPDEEEEMEDRAPAPLSPRARADLARANARALTEKFSAGQPAAQRPGQPGQAATQQRKDGARR